MNPDTKKAFQALSEAVDVMDVNSSIADDDVERWNEVLKTRNRLKDLIKACDPQEKAK